MTPLSGKSFGPRVHEEKLVLGGFIMRRPTPAEEGQGMVALRVQRGGNVSPASLLCVKRFSRERSGAQENGERHSYLLSAPLVKFCMKFPQMVSVWQWV